jgi:hypothetical protein
MSVLTDINSVVAAVMRENGYPEAAQEILGGQVVRCTYDKSATAGYIYMQQMEPVHHGESPCAETICFASLHWFNVDLRASGHVYGIELLAPSDEFGAYVASIKSGN